MPFDFGLSGGKTTNQHQQTNKKKRKVKTRYAILVSGSESVLLRVSCGEIAKTQTNKQTNKNSL